MRLAINGYGRIGRCIVRALYESKRNSEITIAAINEPADLAAIAHLTKFDSTHGSFALDVHVEDDSLVIGNDAIAVTNVADLSKLPWKDHDVDIVLECSGSYTKKDTAKLHLKSGAKKVIFSCPAQPDVDATVVYGLNHHLLRQDHRIISNASCTSNCIAHVIDILNRSFGVESGMITTVHSMMNDQPVIDAYHNPDLRKNRSSAHSIIPVETGLAKGIDRIFPDLAGRFKATALRVPVLNVSCMQLTAALNRKTDRTEINELFRHTAETDLKGILGYTELPLVSSDFNHSPFSAIVDGGQTELCGTSLVNITTWFDNEWGYANRMLDTAWALFNA